jgi:PKD repeat protein
LYDVHPTYVFTAVGSYDFTLTVTDAGGLTSNDTVTIVVSAANASPVANAGSDQTVKSGSLVLFDGGASTDDATTDLNYTWEFVYDGRTEYRYGPEPTFTFNQSGTYTVTLTVRDGEGLTDSDTMTLTVEESSKSFVSQYWWSLTIIAIAAVALAALLLMRRKGAGGSAEDTEELIEEAPKSKVVPPPDEDEL